jgi:hypothetical protein
MHFLVLELIYTEPDGVGFSSSILLCMSVDFKADVFRSQIVHKLVWIKLIDIWQFGKYVEKVRISSKSDKNNEYFKWRLI